MLHFARSPFFQAALALCLASPSFAAPAKPAAKTKAPPARTEINLAHQLSEAGEERLNKLIETFNESQPGVTIRSVRLSQGDKPAPLNLVRRQDFGQFSVSKTAYVPLQQIMAGSKTPFVASAISADLKAGVTDGKGKFAALPVAYSTPVLFYNKNAFRKAGLDPENPPQTWFELQQTADKLQDAGESCPYTSSWPVWVHIDNVSALSGVPVTSGKAELAFNSLPQVKHVAMLATWYKAKFFRHFGNRNEADERFMEGECAMISTDSWAHTRFREAKGVDLGVSPLPHHDDVFGGRQHTLADGASLWVGSGYKPAENAAAAKFVAWLFSTDKQLELARTYGNLPLTTTARQALRGKVQRDRAQTLDVAYASLKGEGATHPLRINAIDPVRVIVEQELEAVWADQKPAKEALDTAVTRGNAVLAAKPALKQALPF